MNLRVNKPLVVYTLLIFIAGVFTTGLLLTANGYDVPWIGTKTALADTNPAPVFFAPDTIEKIVDRAGPAVVKVETSVRVMERNPNFFFNDPFFREFFGDSLGPQPRSQLQQSIGSGFIFTKDGYILTNNHVVAGAEQVKVYLTSRPEPYTAKIIGSDQELDLAIIKIEAGNDLPVLSLGDSSRVNVGNWVVAIGNPYGLDHTVTVGVVSAKGRPLTINGQEFKDLIQTDASINPGNSGGPLLNLAGEVVGINTAINAQAQGIGFAIPSSTVQQVLDQLIKNGKVSRPWMGVILQPVTEELAQYFKLDKATGVLINSIQKDSPAEKAGLQRGDIILEYNGKTLSSPNELQEMVKSSKVGDQAALLIHRNGKAFYVTLVLSER